MFNDALMESAGRLKTQSKYWTLGTFALNGSVVAIMILLPLLHPEALPKTAIAAMLVAPAPPPSPAPVVARPQSAPKTVPSAQFTAPRTIPTQIHERDDATAPAPVGITAGGPGSDVTGNTLLSILGNAPAVVVSKPKPPSVLHISSGIVAGHLIVQTQPVYPPIAQAAHITGSIVLHAMISKSGMIEDLTVQSGPAMLRQAALDGVKNWRYKPFLLNGEPTEVDTTITVNFTNGG
jgi:protein TonB